MGVFDIFKGRRSVASTALPSDVPEPRPKPEPIPPEEWKVIEVYAFFLAGTALVERYKVVVSHKEELREQLLTIETIDPYGVVSRDVLECLRVGATVVKETPEWYELWHGWTHDRATWSLKLSALSACPLAVV